MISLAIFCISTPIGIALAMGLLEVLSMAAGSRTTISLVSGSLKARVVPFLKRGVRSTSCFLSH